MTDDRNVLLFLNVDDVDSCWQQALIPAVARCRETQGTLYLLLMVPGYTTPLVASFFGRNQSSDRRRQLQAQLTAWSSRHVPSDIPTQALVLEGQGVAVVQRLAERINAGLVVVARCVGERLKRLRLANRQLLILTTKQRAIQAR